MKLFDAHCHLQDPRIFHKAPQLIANTVNSGVLHFAVNGVTEVWTRLFFFPLRCSDHSSCKLFYCSCRKIGPWSKK